MSEEVAFRIVYIPQLCVDGNYRRPLVPLEEDIEIRKGVENSLRSVIANILFVNLSGVGFHSF